MSFYVDKTRHFHHQNSILNTMLVPTTSRAPLPNVPTLLGHEHRAPLTTFLERDIPTNLFSLSWLENYGVVSARPDLFHFRALLSEDRAIRATSLVINDRLVLLDALDLHDATTLGRWYRDIGFSFQHVVSADALVNAFWVGYTHDTGRDRPPTARLISPQQLYILPRPDQVPATQPLTGLRCARGEELDALFLASAQMHREETGEDPLGQHPETFRSHIKHRIQTQRAWVWFDQQRRLIFKVDISAQSRYGVQLSGVWTAPFARSQGVATHALTDLCAELFRRGWPRITLYVNAENTPALRVYQRIGFIYHADYKTIFVAQ
jgi:RimJ/RimL family protein N-acetyltransferase